MKSDFICSGVQKLLNLVLLTQLNIFKFLYSYKFSTNLLKTLTVSNKMSCSRIHLCVMLVFALHQIKVCSKSYVMYTRDVHVQGLSGPM